MEKLLFNGHDIALLFTMLFSIMLLTYLWSDQPNHPWQNYFLILFSVSSICIPLDTLINFGAGIRPLALQQIPDIFYVFEFGSWLQAPMMYWFVRSILEKDFRFKQIDVIFVLPFFISTLHQILVYHILPSEIKSQSLVDNSIESNSLSIYYVQFLRDAFRIWLAYLCFQVFTHYFRIEVKSNDESWPKQLSWLKVFVIGFFVASLWNGWVSFMLLLQIQSHLNLNLPIASFGLGLNYFVGLFFLVTLLLYGRSSIKVEHIKPVFKKVKKNKNSQPVNQAYIKLLEPLMNDERLYRDQDLSLDRLAQRVGVSTRTLSNVINSHYGCSYFEFINQYRIKEAKQRLSHKEFSTLAITDIMLDVGFNSKTTFNSFFKKTVGITPSQYRKQHIENT